MVVFSIILFTAVIPDVSKDGILGFIIAAIISVGIVLVFATTLFGSVLVHELAHIKIGMKFGIKTKRILLTPIGGIAEMKINKTARDPHVELPVALAGPTCSAALAGLAALLSLIPSFDCNLLSFVRHINLILAVFNLIPAYPMDGGRILRALLARRLNNYYSTISAQYVSISILFGAFLPIGIFTEYKMLLFAVCFLGLYTITDLVTIKKALKERFTFDSFDNISASRWEHFRSKADTAEVISFISDLETNTHIPFFVTCEALSQIAYNDTKYDYRNCTECTHQNILCSRYDDGFKLLREKAKKEIKQTA